jgi:Flp pilus assembly protein TadG
MALVMNFVMIPLLIGLWEIGRVVQVQQVVSNSAREGARIAAQATTINQTGNPTQIQTSITPAANGSYLPNVKAAVMQSLHGAGLTTLAWSDVTVTFVYTSGATSNTEPYQGVKGQSFTVTVSIPFDKVRWANLGLGVINPPTVAHTTSWQMMVDDPFTVNTTMPNW